MAKIKVTQINSHSVVEEIFQSNTKVLIAGLDPAVQAVVAEILVDGNVDGTLFYVPGYKFKLLKK